MAMSSPLQFQPTTPTSQRHALDVFSHHPVNSSPLASSPFSPKSSPISAAQARRRDQYKQVGSSPSLSRRRPLQGRNGESSSKQSQPASDGCMLEAPRKAILRERFKAKCLERAHHDRARRASGRRGLSSDASSDGFDADMDDADEDEDMEFLNDEVCFTCHCHDVLCISPDVVTHSVL